MIWWEKMGRKGMINEIPFFNDRIWRLNMINRFRSKWTDGTKNENNDKKEIVASNSPIIYKVQIASSDKKINLDSDKFKGVEKPGEYIDKGIYKYTSGECKTHNEALKLQNTLRNNGFKDAFVIAIQDGKRIPLK
jgi:N-acetylmuramoyl-L-alanine amidase